MIRRTRLGIISVPLRTVGVTWVLVVLAVGGLAAGIAWILERDSGDEVEVPATRAIVSGVAAGDAELVRRVMEKRVSAARNAAEERVKEASVRPLVVQNQAAPAPVVGVNLSVVSPDAAGASALQSFDANRLERGSTGYSEGRGSRVPANRDAPEVRGPDR